MWSWSRLLTQAATAYFQTKVEPYLRDRPGCSARDRLISWSGSRFVTQVRALVGKMSSCTGHSYGLNGIGMRRGAQYKVLSTIYNILRRVSLIRHARQGHDFPTTTTAYGDDHVISRATALHTAAEAPHAPHTHARSSASTHGSRPLPSMLPRTTSQTVHSKLDHMAPRATRPRRQHVEVAAQRHDDDLPSQRGLEGARQPSPQRRSARCVGSARSTRPSILNCLMPVKGARAHDQARVKSERDEWGDEVRRAGTAYRAQTFLQAESARAAR